MHHHSVLLASPGPSKACASVNVGARVAPMSARFSAAGSTSRQHRALEVNQTADSTYTYMHCAARRPRTHHSGC